MNLYKISQSVNNDYDNYDSAVVAASSEKIAKTIRPDGHGVGLEEISSSWVSDVANVNCELIGKAKRGVKKGVIVASFNAG